MILIIDNYDSFTWNLVQRLGEIAPCARIEVARNDAIDPDAAERLAPTHVIVSPGPCTPEESGHSRGIIDRLAGRIPILGVCLGHQCIGTLHGMEVRRHRPVHGKTSLVHHDGLGLFRGVPSPFIAARYHSLIVAPGAGAPDGWRVSAWTDDPEGRVVMGLRREWPVASGLAPLEGVQFHPESFLTEEGPRLLRNFLEMGRCAPAGAGEPAAAGDGRTRADG